MILYMCIFRVRYENIYENTISNCISLYFLLDQRSATLKTTASLRGAKRLTVKFIDSDELLPPSKKIPGKKHKIKKKKSEGGELLL